MRLSGRRELSRVRRPVSFQIPDTDLDLDIAVRPVDDLRLHEHVVRDHVDRLAAAIERDGVLRDPVIVDRETGVILDGMHRCTVLDRLGCTAVPVCEVPYADERIVVETWVKVFDGDALDAVTGACAALSIALEPTDAGGRVPAAGGHPVLVADREWHALAVPDASADGAHAAMSALFDRLLEAGLEPRLIPDTRFDAAQTADEVAIVQPRVDKRAVVRAAMNGTPLPPNTSRHVIPTRPVGIDAPLDLLEGPVEAADRALTDRLRARSWRMVPGGTPHEGRVYTEDLLVFE